ncbi:DUF4272 domain-containing protein [Burkholderia plantarii]|nr:DUF4272 domain-containing protein [Burkholderia plantarii]
MTSLQECEQLGYPLPSTLPMLDVEHGLRPPHEIESRALALSAIVAASYGFPRERAVSWLEQETLVPALSEAERGFLFDEVGLAQQFQVQVECLCAFAWVLELLPILNFAKPSPNSLVEVFPDLRQAESGSRFRRQAKLRSLGDVLGALDFAYCLHWGIHNAAVSRKMILGNVPPHVVIERRRALEWLLSQENWADVSLDT